MGEIEILFRGDVAEYFRFQDVDAGIDGIGDDFSPAGLFEELGDLFFLVGNDDTELEGVLHRGEGDGGHCMMIDVEVDDFLQVEVGEKVTADHQETLGEKFFGAFNRSGGTHVLERCHIFDFYPEIRAIPKKVFNNVGLMVQQHYHFTDPVFFQKFHDMEHDGTICERDHRFRDVTGQRLNSGAKTSGHDNGFQDIQSPSRFSMIRAGGGRCLPRHMEATPWFFRWGLSPVEGSVQPTFFGVFRAAFFSSTFLTSFLSSCRSVDLTTYPSASHAEKSSL